MRDEVILELDERGDLVFVDDPETKAVQELATCRRQRLSRIEPSNWMLRIIFYLIRWTVSDNSHLANFTRGWNCGWRANMALSNGPILWGEDDKPFTTRQAALDAERQWISEKMGI